VLELPLVGGAFRVDGGWALAPVGLLRLSVYPRHGVEIALPQAEEAQLRSPDGSRFGFRGWATLRVREQAWEAVHRAAAGAGLRGLLLAAVRAAAADLSHGVERGQLGPELTRDLNRRLSDELSARGVELRRLELDALDFLAVSEGTVAKPTGTRLLVVGLDGADWEIIDGLLDRGKLPHLRRLIDRGVRAKLLTISPMLSPVVWTTVATGVEPSRHGILDFVVADPAGGSQQPVTSAQRRVPTIWEMLSRSGVEVGITAWWASWPADAVRGYLVSDRIAYQLFGYRSDVSDAQGKTWPPDLYEEIRPLIVTPDSIGWERIPPYLGGRRSAREEFDAEEQTMLDDFRTLLASGDTYLAIGDALRRRFEPQLEAVFFEGTDTVGHLFMPYRPPRLSGIESERFESFSPIVDRYYETADAFLGRLLDGRDEDWTILVLSDHGFASDATRPRATDSRIGHGPAADWHRRFGVLILSGAHVRSGRRIDEASVYDIGPTILALFGQPIPRSWPGRALAAALTDEFLDAHPVRYRPDDPDRRDLHAATLDPAAADLLEKLRSLGYVSSGSEGSDSMTAHNNAGVALLAEGRYAEAESEFRDGLEVQPQAPMLWVNLGLALRFQGRVEEARELFQRALPHPGAMRVAGHQLAQLRMEEGKLDAAELLLRQVLEQEPGASELRNLLGLTLERRGELEAAEQEYLEAARLDPDAALARNNLGNLAKRSGQLDQAESWYSRAIEADPYFMGAYNNLALVYQLRGQMDRAIDLYRRALTKAPNNAVVLNNLASLHYATGDFEEAGRIWTQAMRADPSYPSPLNNLASLQINAGRLDEAEQLLQRALELDPGYGDARMNLALVLRARTQFEAAHAELVRATEDVRTGVNSWLQLGMLELEMGNPPQAIATLERARERAPRSIEVLNALGESHLQAGSPDEALEHWRASLEINPGQDRVRQVLEKLDPSTQ
jgi:tetratricopeptide (TPR) repeat protein